MWSLWLYGLWRNWYAAKFHGDQHVCGLCDYEAKDLEQLEIHLSTCECYQCIVCDEKLWQFIKIKEHFETKHSEFDNKKNGIKNIKPSRENSDIYDQKFHSLHSLFPELNDQQKNWTHPGPWRKQAILPIRWPLWQ